MTRRTENAQRSSGPRRRKGRGLRAAAAVVAIAAGVAASSAAVTPQPTPAGVFLEYQVAWILDESPVAIWEKSRRIGADWTEAFRIVRERMSGARTCDYWYSSADESAAAEFIRYAQTWAVELYGAVLEIVEGVEQFEGRDVKTMSVHLPEVGGRRPRITAMASSPKAFRSKGGDVGISELAFHQHAAELWKAAAPVTMWGGRIRVISTHHGVKSKFNELLGQARRTAAGEGRPTDLRASVHRTTIWDAVEQGLVEKINQVTGQSLTREEFIAQEQAKCGDVSVWREEYECEPSEEEATYFPYELLRPVALEPAVCVTDDLGTFIALVLHAASANEAAGRAEADALFAGADIGRRSDLFALWVLAKRGGMRRTAAVLGLRDVKFSVMELAICRLMDLAVAGGVRRICIDETGLGMQLAERMVDRYRTRAEGVTFSAQAKEDLVTTARRDVEELTVTLPDDLGVLGEFNAFRKEVTSAGNVRYVADESREGHSDRAVACFLALHAAKRPGSRARSVEAEGGVLA